MVHNSLPDSSYTPRCGSGTNGLDFRHSAAQTDGPLWPQSSIPKTFISEVKSMNMSLILILTIISHVALKSELAKADSKSAESTLRAFLTK